jgi:hypothetical protein
MSRKKEKRQIHFVVGPACLARHLSQLEAAASFWFKKSLNKTKFFFKGFFLQKI